MNRELWYETLQELVTNKNLLKHMLAAEAIMRALARHFGEDEEAWGLAGLLHDIDYDATKDDPECHARMGASMLRERGLDESVAYAIEAHNPRTGRERKKLMDKALYAVDPLTGLIVAAALIHPARRLDAIDVPFIINRMGEKHFAKGANRDQIRSCAELGLTLEEFIHIGLTAMQGIARELDLS